MTATEMVGWTPVRVSWTAPEAEVEWRQLGTRPFREPFFEDTVRASLADPLSRRRRTGLEALRDLPPGVPPAGFVFHLSRCGSTLVAQALAALDGAVVLSEAPPVDAVVRAAGVPPADRARLLADVLAALGQRRRGDERRLFVKFDCWNALELPVITAAFPDVPWIFVYRDPLEIMVSHQRRPGQHMVPGVLPPRLFGIEPEAAVAMPLEAYGARVLAAICGAAAAHHDPGRSRLVNYTDLPGALPDIMAFFGVDPSAAEAGRLAAVVARDAKNPELAFTDDTVAKRAAVTPALRAAVDAHLMPVYQRLEERRRCTAA